MNEKNEDKDMIHFIKINRLKYKIYTQVEVSLFSLVLYKTIDNIGYIKYKPIDNCFVYVISRYLYSLDPETLLNIKHKIDELNIK